MINLYFWIGFHVFIFAMLALDLGVFNKNPHKISVKEAVVWSIVWISAAMLFNFLIYIEIFF